MEYEVTISVIPGFDLNKPAIFDHHVKVEKRRGSHLEISIVQESKYQAARLTAAGCFYSGDTAFYR